MNRPKPWIVAVSVLAFGAGMWALADVSGLDLTRANFQDGQLLTAQALNSLLNDNFSALETAVNALNANKQNRLGDPCPGGQFVRGVGADGKLACAVDQVGSGGSAGVASLNGKTGSLAIEAGVNVTVSTSDDGKITVSAAGGGGGLSLPYSAQADGGDAAFAITNNSATALSGSTASGNGVYGFSSAAGNGLSGYSERGTGVLGSTNAGSAGVFGSARSASASGVRGENTAGPGVSGKSSARTQAGVYGENSDAGGYGVWGQSEGNGVYGRSGAGFGVSGISDSSTGVSGISFGASGAGVSGVNGRNIGVLGRGPTAMKAEGNAVQDIGSGGWVKAMLLVRDVGLNPAYLERCYNGVSGESSGTCGFTISQAGGAGPVRINAPFKVVDRFFSVTLLQQALHTTAPSIFLDDRDPSGRTVTVSTGTDASFYLIIY